MNLHTPERQDGESFENYKLRRIESRKVAERATGKGLNGGIGSRQQYRDSMRKSGAMGKKTRAYVALAAAWASKRVVKWQGGRDAHGAYTLVGRSELPNGTTDGRRIWLAGISAQRGY